MVIELRLKDGWKANGSLILNSLFFQIHFIGDLYGLCNKYMFFFGFCKHLFHCLTVQRRVLLAFEQT